METRDATSDVTGSNVRTASKPGSVMSGVDPQSGKRVIKLSAKAIANILDRLQSDRKAKFNKAANIRKSIRGSMEKYDETQVQKGLEELTEVCDDVKGIHDHLLGLLPVEENEKHETWFKAKMLPINECIADTKEWLSCNKGKPNENAHVVDDVKPNDSVSNISVRSSHRSRSSCMSSTTSSAAIKAEAEKAALIARAAALKERHALEEQEQQLRRKREQLEVETEIAASNAKLAVLQASDGRSSSGSTNGMNSYLKRERTKKETVNALNPLAKEYEPEKMTARQHLTRLSLPPSQALLMNVQPKETKHQVEAASLHQRSFNEQQQESKILQSSQHIQHHSRDAHPSYHHQIQSQPGDMLSIMHRQNEITTALVQQQRLVSLPPRDIPTFEGDPLQYRAFIKAFEHGVEEKAGQADCLYYLEQFTRGQPRELVRSCHHMAPERGYVVAKELLQQHFGNQYKIASAYMEKALAWQTIKSEDVKALQAYSLFLRGCCNVMEELQYLQELNMPVNMRTIMSKLPFKLREQWRTKAHDIMETTKERACFTNLVMFIERRVSILSDPLFGEIQDPLSGIAGVKTVTTFKSQPRNRVKGNVVATTVTSMEVTDGSERPTLEPKKGEKAGCLCCARSHLLEECKQFKGKMHKEKMQFLKGKGVCFACLRVGHMSSACERRLTCNVCSKTHPTVLHIKRPSSPELLNPSDQPASLKTCGHTGAGVDRCVLSIVPVKVKGVKGNHIITTYAFLDPGSSGTFCTEHLMQKLNVTGRKTNFLLSTMGQRKVVPAYSLTGLEVSDLDGSDFHLLPEVLTQSKMPVTVDNMMTSEELAKWPHLSKVKIQRIKANVDLLIGTNAPKILEPWEVLNSCGNGPYAVKTVLGWVVNGPLNGDSAALEVERPLVTVNRISVCKLEEMLATQYNHDFNEKTAKEKEMSREDLKFLEIMENSAILQEGRYYLKLPFKNKEVCMPNNFAVAKQRIQGLRKRFLNNRDFHHEYAEYMNTLISKSYAEPVPRQQVHGEKGKVWYIPHHGVRHPRKRSLRVVFDCGATFQGVSLNSELLQGPNLTSSLLGVLVRFRKEPVAFMGDIKAMFHQVRVPEEDRDFLRFLWWPDGDVTKELLEYRMTVHLFGAVSSPSCASYALRKTADENQSEFVHEATQSVKQNFYVDDCLKSSATEGEAVQMIQDIGALCQKGGFMLEKWTSNSRIVLQAITEDQRAKDLKELDLDRDKLPVERALGLQWCVETDSFGFKMEMKQQPFTRRGMLSVSSSVYDPLGFLAPVTLLAKMMQQELCRRGCGWDDELPQDILPQWKKWLEDVDQLSAFNVDRCIKPVDFGAVKQAQLHHFADASESGYGTVTYIRMQNQENNTQVTFLLGKARVTPLKAVTIPRLELTAAVLATKVDLLLKSELDFQLEGSVFWTDSTSVLKYLNNEDRRFHTFVANRVSIIRETSEPTQWRHVGSKDNPADYASRGMKVSDFMNNIKWLEGPTFLWKREEDWPDRVLDVSVDSNDQEVRKEAMVNTVGVCDTSFPTDQLIAYFSDWKKLRTAVAWILRLKAMLWAQSRSRKQVEASVTKDPEGRQRATVTSTKGKLTLDDLLEAEVAIIRYCQQQKFSEEIAALSSGRGTVSRRSPIYRLDPVLEDELLRVGGRLSRGAMPEEAKHPLILSKDQHIATLILRHVHQHLGHGGRTHTLSKVRKRFWITSANAAVRKIIGECSFCRRYNGKAVEQKMADLPLVRILPDLPPFTNTGVDYFGPIEVRRGRSTCKRYGVLFTCMASRAVHLEVAASLDTDACINALRRFISRRGQVAHLTSDNGTNFIGADRELKEALTSLNQDRIQGALSQVGIRWSFNPPAGSHHGGVWERMIRLVRRVLSSVLRQQKLDDDGLHTVFCEAEAILNDRPITKLSDDANDLEPLTPNHLLLLKGKPALPPGVFEPHDQYIRRRWKQVQYLSDLFWKRWIREYLPLLQERQRWNEKKRSLTPGDIVVIMDPSAPRGSWPLGKILEVFPDKQGLVRSVKLQTKNNIIERPVTKLCLVHAI